MSHKAKLIIFLSCVLPGLFLQLDLGMHCRCPWGDWSSHFIQGAIALDLLFLARVVYAVVRRRFFDDCVLIGAVMLTSVMWIPLLYKAITAVYLIVTEGRAGELGH